MKLKTRSNFKKVKIAVLVYFLYKSKHPVTFYNILISSVEYAPKNTPCKESRTCLQDNLPNSAF